MIAESLRRHPAPDDAPFDVQVEYRSLMLLGQEMEKEAIAAMGSYDVTFTREILAEIDDKVDAFAARHGRETDLSAMINAIIRLLADDIHKLKNRHPTRRHVEACFDLLHAMLAQVDPEFDDTSAMDAGKQLGLNLSLEVA